MHQLVGQSFNVIGTGPWIDNARDAGFFLKVDLRVACDARGEIRGQREGFVQCICVERLRVSESRGQSLDAGANDIVEGVLGGQAPSGCL